MPVSSYPPQINQRKKLSNILLIVILIGPFVLMSVLLSLSKWLINMDIYGDLWLVLSIALPTILGAFLISRLYFSFFTKYFLIMLYIPLMGWSLLIFWFSLFLKP